MFRNDKQELQKALDSSAKFLRFYYLLVHWLELKQKGIGLAESLESKGIHEVAVYGMKELGELLCRELEGTSVKVAYVIDKDPSGIYTEYPIFKPDDELCEVDAIIVTAVAYYDEIKEMLSEKVSYPVCSLEDIVFEVD